MFDLTARELSDIAPSVMDSWIIESLRMLGVQLRTSDIPPQTRLDLILGLFELKKKIEEYQAEIRGTQKNLKTGIKAEVKDFLRLASHLKEISGSSKEVLLSNIESLISSVSDENEEENSILFDFNNELKAEAINMHEEKEEKEDQRNVSTQENNP
jgi:hypothetical protein